MTWNKWDYLCTTCDGLVEMTLKSTGHPHTATCPRCSVQLTLLSVADATIHPKPTKGNTVDVTTEYNPNLLVTYKKIDGDNTSYVTDKVTQIEWDLDQGRRNSKSFMNLTHKIDDLQEQIVEWFNPNYDKEEVLQGLCEFFDINPTKTVTVDAQINVSVEIQVPIADLDSFDASEFLEYNLGVDSTDITMSVNEFSVEHVNWDVQ